ncbi:MAG: hypothetical protein HY722_01505 [Planctomycetes bacterium]|nr:hypothetical protein [Planctomycetota bacterium]
MGRRRLRYREFLKLASHYGVLELPGRGKGSERLWAREVSGRRLTATVTCHGAGTELGWGLVAAVRRRLELDPAHGIADDAFYEGEPGRARRPR